MSTKLYEKFISELKLKSYAERSIDSYVKSVRQLQRFCNKPLSKITAADLREYWLTCKQDYGWSDATLRISYSGIKHFFSTMLVRKWKILDEVKFKRQRGLPTVLGQQEVRRIICNLPTLQSKVFYVTVYALGLRLKEATHLNPVISTASAAWCISATAKGPRIGCCRCRISRCVEGALCPHHENTPRNASPSACKKTDFACRIHSEHRRVIPCAEFRATCTLRVRNHFPLRSAAS